MTLTVTNTLSGEREPFEPLDPDVVLLYYCGLTVSDDAHLGHARSWVHTDVMHRWLEYIGFEVRHIENFTDVNEKIVARIGEFGSNEGEVARFFIKRVLEDMRSLNLKRAEVYPRVSEHIPEIIALIESLIEKGYAYEANGSVYFDVTSYEDYGKLSNQDLSELETDDTSTERSEKHHPADFALWKDGRVHPEEIANHRNPDIEPLTEPAGEIWPSPWGEGRPGWHIECSAMSMTHLGESFDIHVAGQDLVFPHNENEIAQSEAVSGEEFSRYWLHVRLLETEGEKMSSSLANFFTVRNAVEEVGTNPVRMFLLSTAYSNVQLYSSSTFEEGIERWNRLKRAHGRGIEAVDSVEARTKVTDDELRETVETAHDAFIEGMNDDFNTREAISALLAIATAINRHVDAFDEYDYTGLRRAVETLEEFGESVLGFTFDRTQDGSLLLNSNLVELILELREHEREKGNYDRADELRKRLEAVGVVVEDTDEGPTYRITGKPIE